MIQTPARADLLPVFSTVVFFVYGWALYRFFYHVPSWLYYLQIGEVLILACYVLAYALCESLLVFGGLLLLALLLPKQWLREGFAVKGVSLVALGSLAAFLVQRKIGMMTSWELWQLILYPLLSVLGLLLTTWGLPFVYHRFPLLERFAQGLANRMTVFAYIYPPLSVMAWLVVLGRNLF